MALGEEHMSREQRRHASGERPRTVLKIRSINAVAIILSAVLSLMALVAVERIIVTEADSEQFNEAYRACSGAARDLQEASDFLASEARLYVLSADREYLDGYLNELQVTDRRGQAVETLHAYLGTEDQAVSDLEDALEYSNALVERELYAMKLVATSTNLDETPSLLETVVLSDEDMASSDQDRLSIARQMVMGEEYRDSRRQINRSVNDCINRLLERLDEDIEFSNTMMHTRLRQMQTVIIALLTIVVLVIFAVIFLILWPLAVYTQEIKNDEKLVLTGASELRYLADAYNHIYEENRERTLILKHAAERDPLTGLFNRGAYDQLLTEHMHDVALLLIDIDYFKDVNDTYGHGIGDAILKKVAGCLDRHFRSSDLPCRIGGDEFAVIMTGVTPALRSVIIEKVSAVRAALADTTDGLPRVTLSVGIVFSELHEGEQDLYKAADQALYTVKERGRNGFAFYDEVVGGGADHA